MASEKPHIDPFVASVEAKIAAWTAVLESYRAAIAIDGALPGDRASMGAARAPGDAGGMELPVGVFRDKSLKEAIAIYLGAKRRKQTNKEIAGGLQKGGIATTSAHFEATVATALGRMKEEGTVLRFPDGWDLASQYPDSLRSRLQKDQKPQKAKRGRKSTKKAPAAKKATAGIAEADKTKRVLALIQADGGKGINIDAIENYFELSDEPVSRDYLRVVTNRLAKRGLIEARGGIFFPATAA